MYKKLLNKLTISILCFVLLVSSVSFAESNKHIRVGFGIKNLSLDTKGEDSATLYGFEFSWGIPIYENKYGNINFGMNTGYFYGKNDIGYSSNISIDDIIAEISIGYSKTLLEHFVVNFDLLSGYEYTSFDTDNEHGLTFGIAGGFAYKYLDDAAIGIKAKYMNSSNDLIDYSTTVTANITLFFN
ncbi:hypothetical protein DEFDS_P168 (plasmid) [Deferribacter desulfuricans SSM1]|uniref:Outer membrane protein beta-barrel domain-containing protein n=1 Tax=Deferribacter desulfuricans (strain DSM 14783 / JCM 11476 / NBRC 101012 / SSM1) TaxID=639282 RepID=D3PEZ6_DEFDS|nr:outer membrane beta-barrel protein [Deferribacter desulfuricans]BAI81788.1 hypothetical protein DEFDS_P168 [Deferribacter desulfuricans SSM1]